MENDILTPEGKIMQRAMEAHRAHLLGHDCEGCLVTYGTFLESIKIWLLEGLHDKEATQEPAQGEAQEESPPPKKAGKTLSKRRRALTLNKGSGLHLNFPAKVTPTQLELFGDLKYEDWDQTLFAVAQVRDGGNWWVGDALNYGDTHFGEVYTQAAGETGMSEDTLQRLKYVSSRIDPGIRIKELTWSHHREVAKCTEDEQIRWLTMALEKSWNVSALKEAMRKKGQRSASEGDGEEQQEIENLCVACGSTKASLRICAKCSDQFHKPPSNGTQKE